MLLADWNERVTARTVCNRLNEAGLFSRKSLRKPKLSPCHRATCLRLANVRVATFTSPNGPASSSLTKLGFCSMLWTDEFRCGERLTSVSLQPASWTRFPTVAALFTSGMQSVPGFQHSIRATCSHSASARPSAARDTNSFLTIT